MLDVIPTPDGGYFAIGEFRGFGYGVADFNFFVEPGVGNVSPFMLYLDQDLRVTEFLSLNADAGGSWDGYHHFSTKVKKRPSGGYVIANKYHLLRLKQYNLIA